MQRIAILAATAFMLTLAVNTAHAAGDPVAGKKKAQVCASCHGKRGMTETPRYPKLAGQHASYIFHALMAYKTGARENAVMAGMVANLSKQDMRDIAAYYSSIEGGLFTLPLNKVDE